MRYFASLLIIGGAAFSHGTEFSDGVGATWALTTEGGTCVLEQRVEDFGEVRFSGVAGRPLRFEVLGYRDLFAPGNQKFSKDRAESVAMFLRGEGVRPELLIVRYHGASYPVENNATTAGRARNRLTTVRLARDGETFP